MIVFFVIRVVPGNPIAMMLPPGATAEDIANLTAIYGLDKSIPQQFFIWGATAAMLLGMCQILSEAAWENQ